MNNSEFVQAVTAGTVNKAQAHSGKMGPCRTEEVTEHHHPCSAAGKPDRREKEDVMRQFWAALEGKCLQVESWAIVSGI